MKATTKAPLSSSLETTLPPYVLLDELLQLRRDVIEEATQMMERWSPAIRERSFRISACNLASYLALRRRDLRRIQASLPPLGLSSLGRSEARVMENLNAVIAALQAYLGVERDPLPRQSVPSQFYRGQRLLERNAQHVLGSNPEHRRVRIMVTLPTDAAGNPQFITELMQRGMDCARINCAHDDAYIWEQMIAAIRTAEQTVNRRCHVLMDLGGPKARTGEVLILGPDERLHIGAMLLLTRDLPDASNGIPYQTQCLIPEALEQVQVGQRVWIDDGKIGAVVESFVPAGAMLRITNAREKGEKLKSGKGLNFPDTDLRISPLTDKDLRDLDFAVAHADVVSYSFVQHASDVSLLQREIAQRQRQSPHHFYRRMPIIAKVETLNAIRHLPEIIVQAAGQQPFGLMIARGDLAVEIGFERTAEMQEELLWLCEAAHVPVVWATQVLESYVKDRLPTRAEMTDAAMSERAECVMLNKGPYIADAVTMLDTILTRMQDHQLKKTSHLRALQAFKTE
ncbi:MAG: hypothetical protein KF726_24070 [Anaerolineae bacterium]|nr:hypothetical protein [Anaerolineae bacterium]